MPRRPSRGRAALAEFETIPARARTLPITLALANAYRRTDTKPPACYKERLRMNPHVIEALVALAELRVDAAEIRALSPSGATPARAAAPRRSGTPRRIENGRAATLRRTTPSGTGIGTSA